MSFRLESVGRPALFLLPAEKMASDSSRHAIALSTFLKENFGSYTVQPHGTIGTWTDPAGKIRRGEHSQYRVSFVGKDRINLLGQYLADLARSIGEESIYLETGEDAWLVRYSDNPADRGLIEKPRRPRLLVIVRHGQSVRNVAKGGAIYFPDDAARSSVRGIPDHKIDLTPEGHRQARITGPALRERFGVFDYAYHSGYNRTDDTLTDILAAYPEAEQDLIRIRFNIFLRERDSGYCYDLTTDEALERYPDLRDYWQTFGAFLSYPPGGESLASMCVRVHLLLNMLFRDRAGQKVLLVTHGGTIRVIRSLLEHWDYDRSSSWAPDKSPANCSVTAYQYDDVQRRLVLEDYNTVYY